MKIKADLEMLYSQYFRENNGTTRHYGQPACCQLVLTNVLEVQTNVAGVDKIIVTWQRLTLN